MIPIVAALAAKGLDLIGNAVLAKGQEFIEAKLGVTLEPDIDDATAEKLRSLQFEHEEALLELGIKAQALALEEKRIDSDNMKDARKMGAALAYAPSALNQNIVPILALLTLAAGIGLLVWATESEIRMAAVSFIMMPLGYYFGSSSGSKSKQEMIDRGLIK